MDRDAILNQIRIVTNIPTATVSDADIVVLINNGMSEVGVIRHWKFLEKSATVSLTANTQTTVLPSDFESGVALADDDNDNEITYISPSALFRLTGNDKGNTAAVPEYFTIWAEKFYFSPIPSTTDSARLTIYYYKTITTLSTGSTTPEFQEAFHTALVEYVKWKLWDKEEYFDQADRAFALYNNYLLDMIKYYENYMSRWPLIWGDGRREGIFDRNIPSLRYI